MSSKHMQGTISSSPSAESPLAGFSKPEAPKTLLDFPLEIVREILYWVFAKVQEDDNGNEIAPLQSIVVSYNSNQDPNDNINGNQYMPYFTDIQPSNLEHNSLMTVLLQNRLLGEEGLSVFYSMYNFKCLEAEAFRCRFMSHIGQSIKLLKSVTLGLPYCLRITPSRYMRRYVEAIEDMPALQTFTMSTGTAEESRTFSPNDGWVESNRALLHVAGWLTCRCPRFKYAVWSEQNTVEDDKFITHSYAGRLSITLTSKTPDHVQDYENADCKLERNDKLMEAKERIQDRLDQDEEAADNYAVEFEEYMEYKTYLELFAITPFFQYSTQPVDKPYPMPSPIKPFAAPLSQEELDTLDQDFEPVLPPMDILLNSWKIRRAGWQNLADETARPWNYQLPSTAKHSEEKTPALTTMSDEVLAEELFLHSRNWVSAEVKVPAGKSIALLCSLAASKMQRNVEREDDLRHPGQSQYW